MERSIRAILRAEVGGYVGPMEEAAKATERVGTAAEKAQQQTERSTSRQTSSARRFAQNLNRSARENEQAWRSVGTALTVVNGAVVALGTASANTGIQYNSLRQTATQALTAITGSTEEAVEQMRRMDEFGSTSWLMRDSIIRAQQQMTGFGIETAKVIPYMDALAEGVAAAGGTSQDFEELARIMGQVNSQGKFTAETFNQFGTRGVDAAKMIADAMGTTAGRVRQDITEGAIDAGDALDALAEGLVMNFEGSSDLVRDTFEGAVADVQAAWRDLWAIITTPLVDPEGGGLLVDMFGWLSDLLFWLRDLPDPLLQVVGLLGLLTAGAGAAGGAFLMLYPRIVETWDALGRLGTIGPRIQEFFRTLPRRVRGAAGALTRFAAAAGLAFGALVGGQRIASAIAGFNDTAVAVDLLSTRLRSLGDDMSGYDAILGDLDLGSDKFQDLQSTVENLADLGGLDRFLHNMGLAADRSHVAAEALEQAGVALAQMSEQDFDAAAESFRTLAMEAGGTDQAAMDLIETMPAFRDHLEQMALDMGLATDEATLLRLAMGYLPPEVQEANEAMAEHEGLLASLAERQAEATDRLNEWRDMVVQATEAFPGLLEGYEAVAEANDDGVVSMQAWIEQMQEQAEAVANWQENVLTATGQIREEVPADMQAAGHAMIDELMAAGDEGAAALALFVQASAEERVALIEAWAGAGYELGGGFADEVESARAGEIPVSTENAEAVLNDFLGAIALGEEYVTIGATSVPAEVVLAALEQQVLNSEEEVTINGNDVPATTVLSALMEAIANEEEDVTINGDRIPADTVTAELLAWVREQEASITVDASTIQAEENIRAMMSRWDGKTITLYQRLVQTGAGSAPAGHPAGPTGDRAHGGPIYARASGGRIHGPGTTTSDSIPAIGPRGTRWRLSNDEHIWSAYETRMAGGHAGVEELRSLARTGRIRQMLEGTGYRDGGRPGSSPGISRTFTPPPPPAARPGVTYEVHLHGVPADQPEAFASAALFEMRRFENESAYVRTVTHA